MPELPDFKTYGDVVDLGEHLVELSVALTTFAEGHEPGEPLSAEDLRQVARIIIPDPPRPALWHCWPLKPGV
jgi:hypothetical protein